MKTVEIVHKEENRTDETTDASIVRNIKEAISILNHLTKQCVEEGIEINISKQIVDDSITITLLEATKKTKIDFLGS